MVPKFKVNHQVLVAMPVLKFNIAILKVVIPKFKVNHQVLVAMPVLTFNIAILKVVMPKFKVHHHIESQHPCELECC